LSNTSPVFFAPIDQPRIFFDLHWAPQNHDTMNKLVVLALIVVGVATACEVMYPTYTHRYRLTVEVDVDGKTHSGSSVIEVSLQRRPKLLPETGSVSRIRGDAVFVDLGNAGNLVATLAAGPNATKLDFARDLAIKAFDVPFSGGYGQFIAIGKVRGTREVPLRLLPTLVTFSDVRDPRSARVVEVDEFRRMFGPGVRFRRAFIEMTDEAVTRTIEKQLPWIADYKSRGGIAGRIMSPQQFIAAIDQFTRG
jgi:hypothetical protein